MSGKKRPTPAFESLEHDGYKIKVLDPDSDGFRYVIVDNQDGQRVSSHGFQTDRKLYSGFDNITPKNISLPEEHRGKGIVSRVYKGLEELTGGRILPDDRQSPKGFELHDKHGFGKKFGIADEELNNRLTPIEKKYRDIRKSILEKTMNSTADELERGASLADIYQNKSEELQSNIWKRTDFGKTTNTRDLFNHATNGIGDTGKEAADKLRESIPSFLSKVKALPALSTVSQITPSLADLKEGNPNMAAARMVSSLAPVGSEAIQENYLKQAEIKDKSPYLLDPTYQRTLEAIGERRRSQGKSPVVEAFGGEMIDTSATEASDFENKLKARLDAKSKS